MRAENQIDDKPVSKETSRMEEGFSPGSSNFQPIISAEQNRDALRNVIRKSIDIESALNSPKLDIVSSTADRTLTKDSTAGTPNDNQPKSNEKSEKQEETKDVEFVGLVLRRRTNPEDQLKTLGNNLLRDSADKDKFIENLKKLVDRAKDDELKKEQVDTVFEHLSNLMAGTRSDLSKSAIPENLRVAMTQQLLADLAQPDKLTRENLESKKSHEYRKLDYRFKPDEVVKRITEQVLGKPSRIPDA